MLTERRYFPLRVHFKISTDFKERIKTKNIRQLGTDPGPLDCDAAW
jgi:hypothetical protein